MRVERDRDEINDSCYIMNIECVYVYKIFYRVFNRVSFKEILVNSNIKLVVILVVGIVIVVILFLFFKI